MYPIQENGVIKYATRLGPAWRDGRRVACRHFGRSCHDSAHCFLRFFSPQVLLRSAALPSFQVRQPFCHSSSSGYNCVYAICIQNLTDILTPSSNATAAYVRLCKAGEHCAYSHTRRSRYPLRSPRPQPSQSSQPQLQAYFFNLAHSLKCACVCVCVCVCVVCVSQGLCSRMLP